MLKENKINLISDPHLSMGNWGQISKKLNLNFHDFRGKINCYEWLDKAIKDRSIEGKWIGFLHNTISYPENEYPLKYTNKVLPISDLKNCEYFNYKIKSCLGVIVFTNQIKNYIYQNFNINVNFLYHPFLKYNNNWKKAKQILHVGQQLRKYHSFLEINTNLEKLIIKPLYCEKDLEEMKIYSKKIVKEVDYIESSDHYIELLCNSIVFLDLYDVAACNLILECISLNVPIVVRKLPGCVEYLGEDYPLYFEDLKEAEFKINDKNLIMSASVYLKNMNKERFSLNYFLKNFNNIIENL